MREYRAAPGAGFNDEQAQRYGAFLARKCGTVKRLKLLPTEEIYTLAEPTDSPIHEAVFSESAEEAEYQWRLSRCRHLVSHIWFLDRTPDGEEVTVRAFHNVTIRVDGEPQRGYAPAPIVWKRSDLKKQVTNAALGQLRGWVERYRIYSSLAGIAAQIDEILEEIDDEEGGDEEEE